MFRHLLALWCLCTALACDNAKLGDKSKNLWDVIIVGGGVSGVTQSYLFDLHNRLNEQVGSPLDEIDLCNVLLLEEDEVLGGDAQSKESEFTDNKGRQLAKQLYDYTGPWVYDLGPKRISQLTLRLQRLLAVDSESLVEFMPYATTMFSRGRQVRCKNPNFADYSADDPYGISGSCVNAESFYGDGVAPWSYGNDGIGPAYNLSKVQDWAYDGGDAETLVNLYLLYGGLNPVKCVGDDPTTTTTTCDQCGGCFLDVCSQYDTVKAAMIGELGQELFNLWEFNFGAFYADFSEGRNNPCDFAQYYWLREWDTTAIYGYVVGGFLSYIENMAQPLKNKGNVIRNERVVSIDKTGHSKFVVRTEDQNSYVGKFIIYAGQPEHLADGSITGNFMDNIVEQPEFNSVYSIPVITASVEMKDPFWRDAILPNPQDGATPWVLYRGFGDSVGCLPRIEITNSAYGSAINAFRFSYSDLICKDSFRRWAWALDAEEPNLEAKLWNSARDDLAAAFGIELSEIPEYDAKEININVKVYETGWYYLYSNSSGNTADIREWAAAPLGDHFPLCFAHEAWDYEYLGWSEAGQRMAQRCLDRIVPGASTLLECYMYTTFPSCPTNPPTNVGGNAAGWPEGVSCLFDSPFGSGSNVMGSEAIIPSPFCSERWFDADFVETPNCIDRVELTPAIYQQCLNAL